MKLLDKVNELINEMNILNEEYCELVNEIESGKKEYYKDINRYKSHCFIIDDLAYLENRGILLFFLSLVNLIALLLMPIYWVVLGTTLLVELVCLIKNFVDIYKDKKNNKYLSKEELNELKTRISNFENKCDKNNKRCNEIKVLVNNIKDNIENIQDYVYVNHEVVNNKEIKKVKVK